MAVTIRDVAKLAGTSVSAVSAVLNNTAGRHIRVSEATRQRILEAAKQLGYAPNPLARSLVTGRTGVLGLVFPYSRAFIDRNPFSDQIMSGVFEEVVNEGYNLMLHTAVGNDWNAADEKMLIDPRVDGLILVLPSPNSSVIARCQEVKFPAVAVVYATENKQVCTINADDQHGGFLATQHLIELGHTRIAHFVGDPKVSTAQPRLQGYLKAMEQAGLQPEPEWMVQAGFDWKDGYSATQRILRLPKHKRPTAIFAANDLCAEGAIRALREQGISVPKQMSIVGYDDTWFATMTTPPLTSVHMPIYEMGKLAAQVLIALVEGREVPQRQYTLPVHLTVRQSTAPPPKESS